MDKIPYVHLYTDGLGVMQILARGSNAAVFLTLGMLLPTRPDGASETDVIAFTGLSKQTVRLTLANLQHSGLVQVTRDGTYKTARYIEYRKPSVPGGMTETDKNNSFVSGDQSILSQSIENQSNRQSVSSGKEEKTVPASQGSHADGFAAALQALASVVMLNSTDYAAFAELWADFPDPELHARALEITRDRAEHPNFRYYERVVKTGARVSAPKKESPAIEVLL